MDAKYGDVLSLEESLRYLEMGIRQP